MQQRQGQRQRQGQCPWAACPGQAGRDSSCSAGRAGVCVSPGGCRNCRSILGITLRELRPSAVRAPPERKKGADDTVAKPQESIRQLQECGASLHPSRSPPGTVRHKLETT